MSASSAIERHWKELGLLFDQAWDLPAEARARFISEITEGELREALVELLLEAERDSPLDEGSARLAALLLDPDPGIEGSQLGAWRVGRLLGRGGMASVFLAERADGSYNQKVAIKILRYGAHEEEARARFVLERRILARLDHPHIAHLLDGGFTAAGVPWFALEYVEGEPVTHWCDRHRLDVDARLQLFTGICATVAYAHHNLVVHRDLKPANILVRGDGELKLLDFGIAKLLDAEETTRTQARLLTPSYAAPEQHDGSPITTATDTYALGVLLHELLTGALPLRREDASLVAPASAVTGSQAHSVAQARGSDPSTLRRRIGGELTLILSRALQPEPSSRYAGADELARDLQNHLRRLPISARPDSRGYRFWKFVQRHCLGFGFGAAFLLAILAGLAATLWQAQVARREAARANATRNFVLALFEGVTPDESKGREVSVRELLDRGAAQLSQTLSEEPEFEVDLIVSLAAAYRQLGGYEQTDALLTRALQHTDNAQARGEALAERGRLRLAQGQLSQAAEDLRHSIRLNRTRDGQLQLQLQLAHVLAEQGQLAEARELAQDTLVTVRHDASETEMLALAALGTVHFHAGDLEQATAVLREALALRRARSGEAHTRTAAVEHDLGVVLLRQGDDAAAAALFRQALATRQALLGGEHPDVAETEFNLGAALRQQGDLRGASEHIAQATAMQERLLGTSHPAVANGYNSLALIAYAEGDFAGAIEGFSRAIASTREAYGEPHPALVAMLNNLSGVERAIGHLEASEASARRAVANANELGAKHYLLGVARLGLGNALTERGNLEAALRELEAAHVQLSEALGPEHQSTLLAQAALAIAALRSGQIERAREQIDQALQRGEKVFPPGHPQLGKLRLTAARTRAAQADCGAALLLLQQARPKSETGDNTSAVERSWAAVIEASCLPSAAARDRAKAVRAARAAAATAPWIPPDLSSALAALD